MAIAPQNTHRWSPGIHCPPAALQVVGVQGLGFDALHEGGAVVGGAVEWVTGGAGLGTLKCLGLDFAVEPSVPTASTRYV
jgi:hypothetical protein